MNWKELAKRLLVAAIAIPLVCFCIFYPIWMNIVTSVLSYVGTKEWVLLRNHIVQHLLTMCNNDENKASKEASFPEKPHSISAKIQVHLRCLLSVSLPLIGFIYYDRPVYILGAIICVYILMFVGGTFGLIHSGTYAESLAGKLEKKHSNNSQAVIDMVALALDYYGILYVGFSLAMALMILRNTPILLFLILFANWAADAFAMFAGKNFGRHKLCPTLSPNKTIEGAIGALVGSVLFSLIVRFVSLQFNLFVKSEFCDDSIESFVLNGILLGVLSVVGDLLESFYKRVALVKDSGDFFGAHGGVLDRIDGLLFTFPIMYGVNKLGFFRW
jgi:CDP-diglyceride synthetase